MKKLLTILTAAALLLGCLALPAAAAESGFANFQKTAEYAAGQFPDVAEGEWYTESVAAVYELGLMKGNADGSFNNTFFFWLTGMLSAFLDNAPTYLAFFNLAGGDPTVLMGEGAKTLMAISMGSVFMGAVTYIGNAPNFMTVSICNERGIKMPTFFGYMLWSVTILFPTFFLMDMLFLI